jgi:hypothetical protein
MAYTPQTWVDNNASYPLSAARMNTMESGISSAASVADQGHMILTTAERDALGAVTAGTTIYNSTLTRVQTYYAGAWVDSDTFRTVGANKYNNLIVPPAVRATRTTVLSYTSNSDIAWDSVSSTGGFNTDGMWSAGSPTLLTVQTAGIYLVTFNYYLTFTGTVTQVEPYVVSSAASFLSDEVRQGSFTTFVIGNQSGMISFAAGDTIAARLSFTGGSAYSIPAATTNRTALSAVWLGRAS